VLKIIYKNQDQVNTVAYINPDHIVYVSGNSNGTTYVKLTGDGFLFAMEPVAEIQERLTDLLGSFLE
jgi:hypothetical protein